MSKTVLPKTKIIKVQNDWKLIKNHCRATDNKDFTDAEPTDEWVRKLLMTEHSPIRECQFVWRWEEMPYWVSTELSRHKFEKFISTQRDDRVKDVIPRGKKPQDALVTFDGFANEQSLIDMARKRLCFCATQQARNYVLSLKFEMKKQGYKHEADVLVPNCIYRGFCPEEFNSTCKFFENFLHSAKLNLVDLSNGKERYDFYNKTLEDIYMATGDIK